MLDDKQRSALGQWYRRVEIRGEVERMVAHQDWEGLEEFIQMRALFPLSRHHELPDYLLVDGAPLIPSNCNPRTDVEEWKDAVEVGWEVVQELFGLSRDEIHLKIKEWQEKSWEVFMKSVDERRGRGGSPD